MAMKIQIKGVIVPNDEKWIYELFGFEVTTPDDVNKQIEKANGEDLEVIINSPGGDVYSGSEIYTSLADYKGRVEVKIVGVAASAASVIAMAGDVVKISPTAQIMVHNVWEVAQGDYRVFEHEAEVLKGFNKSIANAYMLKTGMTEKELLKMMDEETWLTAQKAKEYGFVDEIMFDTGNKLAAAMSYSGNMLLPREVINKIRESLANGGKLIENKESRVNEDDVKLKVYKAKLNLLKLRRVN